MDGNHMDAVSARKPPSFGELFTPKLVTVLRGGYGLKQLQQDAISGLTVAIVALPLSMAIAIASGVSPDRGLFTAIVGGFLVSALGGSRFQIGGPAGAFIVLVAATVARNGVEGLVIATMLSGVFMLIIGYLRLGTYIKFIPYPVTVGFTAGIGVIIFASQLKELLGLTVAKEPGELVPKLIALSNAIGTLNDAALAISLLTIAIVVVVRMLRPNWPSMLIGVAAATALAAAFSLPVETIGTRFGGIPRTLPMPSLPDLSLDKVLAVLPAAVSFALLGTIESLLSAVVADGMTGRRHRSNCELVGQGFANIASALFGGICVTGTIARTATNVRSGAYSPVSGMLHAGFLLLFMLVAAPLAGYIPLAALAGVLAVVSYNMVEKEAMAALVRSSLGDALVLLVTFALVIFRDLSEGIVVGFLLGSVLFIHRMSHNVGLEQDRPLALDDVPDSDNEAPRPYAAAADPDTAVYRLSGAFFFGAATTVGNALDMVADHRRNLILDFAAVPFLDSSAAKMIEGVVRKAAKAHARVFITSASATVRNMLAAHGVKSPHAHYARSIDDAKAAIQGSGGSESPSKQATFPKAAYETTGALDAS
jgi:SulP family sulfate permease